MNPVAALLCWLFQLPPLQAMRWGARSMLEFILLALIDPETQTLRRLDDAYLGFLHRCIATAAMLIDHVVGARAIELSGGAASGHRRSLPDLPHKPCDQAAMIRRACDLLQRLDRFEAAARRLVRRFEAERAEAQRIGRIAGLPANAPAPADVELDSALLATRVLMSVRALELSG
jgi:hypothetical protein